MLYGSIVLCVLNEKQSMEMHLYSWKYDLCYIRSGRYIRKHPPKVRVSSCLIAGTTIIVTGLGFFYLLVKLLAESIFGSVFVLSFLFS